MKINDMIQTDHDTDIRKIPFPSVRADSGTQQVMITCISECDGMHSWITRYDPIGFEPAILSIFRGLRRPGASLDFSIVHVSEIDGSSSVFLGKRFNQLLAIIVRSSPCLGDKRRHFRLFSRCSCRLDYFLIDCLSVFFWGGGMHVFRSRDEVNGGWHRMM